MKKLVLTLLIMFAAVTAQAQCTAEVKNVLIDTARGSIIVETQYKLNGVIVDTQANPDPTAIGRTRYTDETGTLAEIRAMAQQDITQHCENLIIRHAVNVNDLSTAQLNIIKALTQPLADDLAIQAIGWTKTVTQKIIQFRNKEITIEADGTYTVNPLP